MTFSVTEVIVYGLLAAAIVAGVLYAGGRTPVQIGATAGAIVGFVALFALIAPRARRPVKVERTDETPPPADTPPSAAGSRVDHGQSPLAGTSTGDQPRGDAPAANAASEQRRNHARRGRRRRARHAG